MPSMRVKNRITGASFRRICLLLSLVLAGFRTGAQVQETYLEGIALADRTAYREAREHFEEALRYDRENPEYLLKLAEVCRQAGDREAALGYLRQLEAVDPGRGSYMLAGIYATEGNAAEAVRQLEVHLRSPYRLPSDVILLDPTFAGIEGSPPWKKLWSVEWYTADEELLQEIRYLTGSGDYLQALEIIDRELGENPAWDALHAARGRVLLKMGQFQGAVQSYTRAIQINPANPSFFHERAEAWIGQGKYDKAIPDLEKASRMEPGKLELLLEIGKAYHKSGLFDKAAGYLERFAAYYPDDPDARFELGTLRYDAGDYLAALQQFNACLQLDGTDPRFYAARGKTYLETRTYRYALNDFGMALDLDAGDPETWYLKGQARWYMNDRVGAVGDWQHAARLGSREAAEKLVEHAAGE
jgi:tetratricopeptide (TPR) repeat protein